LINADGTVAERYLYDAYGTPTVLDADWSVDGDGISDVANPILYAGYFFDSETANFHVRNRYLHTALGRWMSRDPIGYKDGLNLYEYVRSNPTERIDPMGTQTFTVDLWERDIVYDDHLARFTLDVSVACRRVRGGGNGCCYTPYFERQPMSTQTRLDSMGPGYGQIDLVGSEVTTFTHVLQGYDQIGVAWEGHATEGPALWAPALGNAIGTFTAGSAAILVCGVGSPFICLGAATAGGLAGTAVGTWLGEGFGASFTQVTAYWCRCDGSVGSTTSFTSETHGDNELYWQ
jgi:RHS repeat-associated protein